MTQLKSVSVTGSVNSVKWCKEGRKSWSWFCGWYHLSRFLYLHNILLRQLYSQQQYVHAIWAGDANTGSIRICYRPSAVKGAFWAWCNCNVNRTYVIAGREFNFWLQVVCKPTDNHRMEGYTVKSINLHLPFMTVFLWTATSDLHWTKYGHKWTIVVTQFQYYINNF